jgi:glycosyltransferase involved in cell wall biosynthesis
MRIVVLPSWYPTREQPHAGGFIRGAALAVADAGVEVAVLFPELRSLREWRPGAGSGELVESRDGPINELRWLGYRWWPRERHGTVAFASAARRLMCEYVSRHGPPDLVHAHVALPAGAAAAQLAGVWGVPMVLTEHAGPFAMMTQTLWQRWGVRRAVADAAAITAVSPALAAAMRAEGVTREIEIVPNTLDPVFCAGDDSTLTPTLSRSGRGSRFLSVTAMRAEKGVGELIEAFARVARRVPSATLTLAGDGPDRDDFVALAVELGLTERVRFSGLLRGAPAVREAMCEADVFVLASHAETFGVALIEAMACGRPVVATRCGGPESIVTEVNGRLVRVGDIAGLAEAMEATLRGLERFDAAATRADCLARFGPGVVGRRYVEVYERVAGQREHASPGPFP